MQRTDTHTGGQIGTAAPDDLLTRKEAAELVNYSVSTVRRWDRTGILPRLRNSAGQIRYRRADVLAATEFRPVDSVA